MTEIKPAAWHCVGAGDGWAEDKIVRDPETADNYASRPHQWSVRPLYGPEAMAEIERLLEENAILDGHVKAAIEDYNDAMKEVERLRKLMALAHAVMRQHGF